MIYLFPSLLFLVGILIRPKETLPSTFTALPQEHPESRTTNSTSTSDMAVEENTKSNANDKKRKLDEEAAAYNIPPWAPPAKKARVVIGISIPPPEPLKEQEKERAKARRAREKQELREANKAARIKARRQAMDEGTFDFEKDERRRQEIEISRIVNTEIRKRTLQEEFGPVLPTPTELLKIEKDAAKVGPAKFHETELAKLSVKVHGVSDRH
jgi:hypothetical protein